MRQLKKPRDCGDGRCLAFRERQDRSAVNKKQLKVFAEAAVGKASGVRPAQQCYQSSPIDIRSSRWSGSLDMLSPNCQGNPERLRALADELVHLKVDVIVTEGTTSTRFAKEATSTVPIVMAQDPDPVGTGFVASLARPGGNITGLSNLRSDLGGKRLEILKDTVPGLARVAIIGTSTTPGYAQSLVDVERAAGILTLRLQVLEISGPQDIETAFQAATDGRAHAVLVLASPHLLSNRARVADVAAKSRIPTIYYASDYVKDGGLMSYGVSTTDLFRRAANYVDKIVKGAKAGDLPIEQPTRFEFIINLRSANAIGLTIPPVVLSRADEVIE